MRGLFLSSSGGPAPGLPLPESSVMTDLFTPLRLGDLDLPNRVIMAPLTRARAGAGRVPTPLMAAYYAQRASAGLILSEATSVSPQGVGYPDTPGLWSEEQVQGWAQVTRAVHAAGGRIYAQLWHVGRVSHSSLLDGALPVAPSAIAMTGHVSLLRPKQPYEVPRALETAELAGIVADYRRAAENARRAGFDGVEIHGANGYLLDQFLHDGTNTRTDDYGGSIENRARLLLEVTDAVTAVWGKDRVGVHLSPRGDAHEVSDSNPRALFSHVVTALSQRGIAFLCVREGLDGPRLGPDLRALFKGVYIANEGFTGETAEQVIAAGEADAVAFGKDFIATPDLPRRLADGQPLNDRHPDTFYGAWLDDKRVGYVDYPALALA